MDGRFLLDTNVIIAFFAGDTTIRSSLVELTNLRSRVKEAEAQELGWLGSDDLFIKVEPVVEIQYCHHADIHLTYIQDDHPLAKELATYLTEEIGLHEL